MRPHLTRRSFLGAACLAGICVAAGQTTQRPRKRVGIVGEIRYLELPEDLERRAKDAMPLQVGGEYSAETLNAAISAMKAVDSRLQVR